MRRTLWRVRPRRVTNGQGGEVGSVGLTTRAGVRRDAQWVGVQAGRAGGPGICCSGSSVFEAAGERGNGVERSGLLKSVARWMQLSLLLGIVLIGALCFALGASLAPPPVQFSGAAESMLITVSEQRACQALRVEADRKKLETLCAKAGPHVPGRGQVV